MSGFAQGSSGGPLSPLRRGIVHDNPVFCQVLGICSALAVTNSLDKALVMCAALGFVAAASCLLVSLLRQLTPHRVRMITQVIIIATVVTMVELFLKAYYFSMSRRLGAYVGLIVTNCIIMGRCEAFASRNRPIAAAVDGLSNAAGYAMVLCAIALVREPLGAGPLLGEPIMPEGSLNNRLMAGAPGAFLAMGVLAWVFRAIHPVEQTAGNR